MNFQIRSSSSDFISAPESTSRSESFTLVPSKSIPIAGPPPTPTPPPNARAPIPPLPRRKSALKARKARSFSSRRKRKRSPFAPSLTNNSAKSSKGGNPASSSAALAPTLTPTPPNTVAPACPSTGLTANAGGGKATSPTDATKGVAGRMGGVVPVPRSLFGLSDFPGDPRRELLPLTSCFLAGEAPTPVVAALVSSFAGLKRDNPKRFPARKDGLKGSVGLS
ncbi:hypothetical protein BC830DRAFT_921811 [Chytriomyces sp. MP71]|nr:hypothetical protein BC830DRAFT_921811 [Chytriomyces sp. MP71]